MPCPYDKKCKKEKVTTIRDTFSTSLPNIYYLRMIPFFLMAKIKLDLHDVFSNQKAIEAQLNWVIKDAARKKIELVEIIPGKGSGQLKKHVLRFLARPEIKKLYQRIEKDDKNFGRVFVHFRF